MEPEFNPEKHKLSSLCKRNHEYRDTGKTLRYLRGGSCVACNSQSVKNRRAASGPGKNIPGAAVTVTAKCPYCEKLHRARIAQGWIGTGTPRVYCPPCQGIINKLSRGALFD